MRSGIVSHSKESLRLYRSILRTSQRFDFPDNRGRNWKELIRESARKEFEAARHEKDPEIILKLMLGGRDALFQIEEKFAKKQHSLLNDKK